MSSTSEPSESASAEKIATRAVHSQLTPDEDKQIHEEPKVNDGPLEGRKLTGITWFIAIIIDTFGQIDLLTWVLVAYPLGEIGSNPLWSKLNIYFNNKILYLITLIIFEVGSAIIGSAQSMIAVIIGRAIAGLGGSGIYVCTINIVLSLTALAEQNHYFNYVAIAWALRTVLGPIIGGTFAGSAATWR
ncbi:hypothetical protein F5B18DRAFT_643856 [Nemania serpens]|nr:hypothetical protein F5B18DRAFT_643856 [Nemania serpens]